MCSDSLSLSLLLLLFTLQPEEEQEALAAVTPPVEEKPKPLLRDVQQPVKPIKKLVSRPRVKLATPPPPRSPTPPSPPTPLPDFIAQFVGTDWFEKYFPNCNESVSVSFCFSCLFCRICRLDMTCVVDWALKANYLSIYLSVEFQVSSFCSSFFYINRHDESGIWCLLVMFKSGIISLYIVCMLLCGFWLCLTICLYCVVMVLVAVGPWSTYILFTLF